MSARRYLNPKGPMVEVCQGFGKFFAGSKSASGLGSHKMKSPATPARDTAEEAQRDLDAYATKHGWAEVPQ